MAGLGFSEMGSAIGGFFGDDKLKQKHYNRELAKLYNTDYIDALKALRGTSGDAATRFASTLAEATPQARQIAESDISDLGSLIRGRLDYDPVAVYERLRSGNFDALSSQAGRLADIGSRAQKLSLAARGYGGRGDSGYERILTQDRVSRNIAPVIAGIFSNLGSDTATLENNRWRNLLAYLDLMGTRAGVPDRLAERELLPAEAQASLLSNELGAAGALGAGSRENTAGFQLKKNKWKNFFEQKGAAMDEVSDTAINTALKAAEIYFGGAGGAAGGMGGLGGALGSINWKELFSQ